LTAETETEPKTFSSKEEYQRYLRATEEKAEVEKKREEKEAMSVAQAQNNFNRWKLLADEEEELKHYGLDPSVIWDELKHCREERICQRCGYKKRGKKWQEIPGSLDNDKYDLCSKCCKELLPSCPI
jgi:hypothetical protein